MADSSDPVLEIVVVADWNRFDEQMRQRQSGSTFALEGGGTAGRALPYQGSVAGGAAGDFTRSASQLERAALLLERVAGTMATAAQRQIGMGNWSSTRSPQTGRFTGTKLGQYLGGPDWDFANEQFRPPQFSVTGGGSTTFGGRTPRQTPDVLEGSFTERAALPNQQPRQIGMGNWGSVRGPGGRWQTSGMQSYVGPRQDPNWRSYSGGTDWTWGQGGAPHIVGGGNESFGQHPDVPLPDVMEGSYEPRQLGYEGTGNRPQSGQKMLPGAGQTQSQSSSYSQRWGRWYAPGATPTGGGGGATFGPLGPMFGPATRAQAGSYGDYSGGPGLKVWQGGRAHMAWTRVKRFMAQDAENSKLASMYVMFGAFEVANAYQMVKEGNAAAAYAETGEEALIAQATGIQGAASGILGAPAALGLNLIGNFTNNLSPIKATATALHLQATRRVADQAQVGFTSIRQGRAFRDAGSGSALAMAQAEQKYLSEMEALNLERSNITGGIAGAEAEAKGLHDSREWWNSALSWSVGLFPRTLLGSSFRMLPGADTSEMTSYANTLKAQMPRLRQQRENIEANRDFERTRIAQQINLNEVGQKFLTQNARYRGILPELESSRNDLITTQNLEQRQIDFSDPALSISVRRRHEAELGEFDRNISKIRRQEQSAHVGNVRFLGFMSRNMPYMASLSQIDAQFQSAIEEERDPIRKRHLQVEYQATRENAQAEYDRGYGNSILSIRESTATTDALIRRDPLGASLNDLASQRNKAFRELPNDAPGAIRDAINRDFDQREVLLKQQHRDQRHMDNRQMQRQERVSDILADPRAHGGRSVASWTARTMQITGEAEDRAQMRLMRDSTDTVNAARERRIGINELKATRSNYLDSFVAQEGSLNRTALSGGTGITGGPEAVLHSIDLGIKELNRNLERGPIIGE